MSNELHHITLTREDDWWVARDDDSGVTSQGPTRVAALEDLDEAIELTQDVHNADTPAPEPDAPWFESA